MAKRFLLLLLLFLIIPGCNNGDTSSDPADISTPVIFVHGIESTGGDTFYAMYERFESYGYSSDMMVLPLLPRMGIGTLNSNYAWYIAVSPLDYSSGHWEGNNINADALKNSIDTLAPGGKVDLVGHSNGTAVILKFLARYPSHHDRIRKIVFISGFADVSGADGLDNIVSDLDSVMPFGSLPGNIVYYALSSESDANINYCELVYGVPDNDNPYPFNSTMRFWNMDVDAIDEMNCNITGLDHQSILTGDESINRVFKWLTGRDAPSVETPPVVELAGRIVCKTEGKSYSQQGVTSGTVTAEYYDIDTGLVTGQAGTSAISSEGRYSIGDISTNEYIKLTVTANGGTDVYFFANRLRDDSRSIDFRAPDELSSGTGNGCVMIRIMCRYSYLSTLAYLNRVADRYSGTIEAEGCITMTQGDTCLPAMTPSSYLSTSLRNYGTTDTLTANVFNFDPDGINDYASKDVYVTADLQDTGRKVRVKINGSDRMNNIENHILYLYRD